MEGNELSYLLEMLRQKQQAILNLVKSISQTKIEFIRIENLRIRLEMKNNPPKQKKLLKQEKIRGKHQLVAQLAQNVEINDDQQAEKIRMNPKPKDNFSHLCSQKIDWKKEISSGNIQIVKYFKNHPNYLISVANESEVSKKYGRAIRQNREKLTEQNEKLLLVQLKHSDPLMNYQTQEEKIVEDQPNQDYNLTSFETQVPLIIIHEKIERKQNVQSYLESEDKHLIKNFIKIKQQIKCRMCKQNFKRKNGLKKHFLTYHKGKFKNNKVLKSKE